MELIESRDNHSHATIYYDKKRFVRIGWNEEVDFDDVKMKVPREMKEEKEEKEEKREKREN
jgi:uncharacterized protein YdhG (YjbR/CyaY superfamily)